jgi:hypothetical protein
MANKRFMDFTTDEMPSASSYLLEADSVNGVRKCTIENAVAGTNIVTNVSNKVTNVFYNNAAAHNGIYRGKDLTNYFDSGEMSVAISAGTFDDIYIGDYITKTINIPAVTYTNKSGTEVTQTSQTFTDVKWLVAAIDVHLGCGDIATTEHHVLLIPNSAIQRNVNMNPTNDTTGAYLGSDMWTVHMPIWTAAIKSAFGSTHVLSHKELLSNATDTTVQSTGGGMTGKASNFAWVTVEGANIPKEAMIYGGSVWGSSYDVGDFPRQLPLYALKCNHIDIRNWSWLRTVASSARFSVSGINGSADRNNASVTNSTGGILPYFLLK